MEGYDFNRRRLMQMLAATMAGTAISSARVLAQIQSPGATGQLGSVFIPKGAGRKGKFGVNDIIFKLNKSQTGGNMGSAEIVVAPGHFGAPPHFHHTFDEICRVLEGTISILVGSDVTDVPAGGWHLRRRGMVHAYWNSGKTPAKSIEIYLPGGHEEYMQKLADLFADNAKVLPADVEALGKRFDTTFVWERLPQLVKKYKVTL